MPRPMLATIVRWLIGVALATLLGWWLFADTVRRHLGTVEAPLRISFWGEWREYEMWTEILARFERERGIAVKGEYLPGGRYEQKVQQMLVAGNAPDVILWQDEPFPKLVQAGTFADLTPWLRDLAGGGDVEAWLDRTSHTTAWRSFGRAEAEGWRQYGVPIFGGCNMLFANRELFAQSRVRIAELPGPEGLVADGDGWVVDDSRWTVDEFARLARHLTVDRNGDGRPERFGFSLPSIVYWLPFMHAYGCDVLDPTRTRSAFAGPGCEAALALWQDAQWGPQRFSPRDELGTMSETVAFYSGRVAMFSSGPWAMPFLYTAGVDFVVLHVPRGPAGRGTRITWDTLALNPRTTKRAQALELIRFCTLDAETQRTVGRYQRSIPALRAAASSLADGNPRAQTRKFVEAAEGYARMQPISVHWGEMSRAWIAALEGLQNDDPASRYTVREAIGRYHADPQVRRLLPPADPDAVRPYVEAYDASGKP